MSAVFVVASFFAVSGSATFGFFLCGLLTASKLRNLEIAYLKLSAAIREFLGGCPSCEAGMLVLEDGDICRMQKTLRETDAISGLWTIEDFRR